MSSKPFKMSLLLVTALIVAVVGLTACGGDGDSSQETPTAVSTSAASPTRQAGSPTAQAASPTVATSPTAAVSTPSPQEPTPAPPQPTTAPVQPTTAPQPTTALPPPQPPPTSAPPPPPAGIAITINGVNSTFSPRSATSKVGAVTTITFNNQDVDITHDFVLFDPSGTQVGATELATGPIVQTVVFTPTVAGGYYFKCSVHPQQMTGTLTVQ